MSHSIGRIVLSKSASDSLSRYDRLGLPKAMAIAALLLLATAVSGAPPRGAAENGAATISFETRLADNFHNTGALCDPITDTRTPSSTLNAPTPRALFAYVWTGTQMIVWAGRPSDPFGGEDCFGGEGVYTRGQDNPSTDSWRSTPIRSAPGRRYSTKGVWDRKRNDRLGRTPDRLGRRHFDERPFPTSAAVNISQTCIDLRHPSSQERPPESDKT